MDTYAEAARARATSDGFKSLCKASQNWIAAHRPQPQTKCPTCGQEITNGKAV